MTGIFVPENYCPQSSVDLLVYLHGYKYRAHKPEFSIDSYWRLPQFLLREAVIKSQRNLILVAPTLGPKNEPGSLANPNGFDRFLDQVMAVLRQYGPYTGSSKAPSVRNLILACHSGSGWVMRKIARGGTRHATQIRECWAFDPYGMGDAGEWADWARSNPRSMLYIYYRPGSPGQKLSSSLIGRSTSNVQTLNSRVGHDDMPAHFLKDRLEGAPFLAEKSNCSGKRAYSAQQEFIENENALFESDLSFFEGLQYAVAAKEWNWRLMLSWYAGLRDENKLTNIIFFNRHPERNGRKLEKSEPNFRELSREWLAIRDHIIRPFIANRNTSISSGAQPTGSAVDGKPYPEVNMPLPSSGTGFIRRKRGKPDEQPLRSYGLPETIQALQEIAATWYMADSQRPLIRISDISPPGGRVGPFKRHRSHRVGLDVDLSLEGGESNMDSRAYSRSLTEELARLILSRSWGGLKVKSIYFDDSYIHGIFNGKVTLADKRGNSPHRDHFHVRFCTPAYFAPKLIQNKDTKYNCPRPT